MDRTGIAALVLLAALAGGVVYKETGRQPSGPATRGGGSTKVVVAPAEYQPMQRQVEALGTVKARESVLVAARITERVQQVHFDDGDRVRQGALLVTLRDAEQRAKLQAAQANLLEQQREYRRIEGLVKAQTVASNELDKLLTRIDVAKATLAQYQAELDARYIRAPFDGLLGFREISPGALVTPGTTLTTLDDLAVVKLDFTIPERFLSQLTPGNEVQARAAAYPEQVFRGKVRGIDSRVDPQTRAVVVRAELANPDLQLRPGMLMTLSLVVEQRHSIVVAESALVPRQDKQFVYVVDGEQKIEQREVVLGLRRKGEVEILSGLAADEAVVILGTQSVRPGQAVTVELTERFGVTPAMAEAS
ncbi:efflux RND transporter periplasmic adaptor subunit [Ferrimonas pelagia]|uniref:Efflux RND transporter periplasmic adaptor subunit n=1 Tax=Ferrimonas pelagia TaxID=1177826 RepID=A0ABP9EJ42_9GAMM